ncbi:DMT family transporter [Vagococcus carniphilus]|uniref:QacE family quaternary ammonium compound efflux SMR transporter n=1 Tax=Vagococcus carniphilus TaxID=218144 RepID=A0A430AUF6_9ENTE|nr:multidrug efflux SMR transporter [Vagococcus carniphilus]QNN71957.1 multidrug efflux SMR transporter [Vagococcus carniphilus]RSU11687.1 QacE family quaternary ammonium compound efflux SMR transporter [Vagococcus carniphilus]
MNRSWLSIVIAAVFEVMWVIGLKHAASPIEWTGTVIAIFISFYLMIKAGEKLPVGTVYAVFVGLGTTGTILVDAFIFKQPVSVMTIVFLGILLIGVMGLKLSSDGKKESEVK